MQILAKYWQVALRVRSVFGYNARTIFKLCL